MASSSAMRILAGIRPPRGPLCPAGNLREQGKWAVNAPNFARRGVNCSGMLCRLSSNLTFFMLIPGFANVPVRPSSQYLHLITFGRMDRESDRVKQGGLAVAG